MKNLFLVKIPSKTEFYKDLFKMDISIKLTIFWHQQCPKSYVFSRARI